MLSEQQVWEVLKDCYDPEIPINLVDLGLIYDVKVDGDVVRVKMTLTAPGCPMHSFIAQQVQEKLLSMESVTDALVEVVWDPPWSPAMMSEEAKAKLGFSD